MPKKPPRRLTSLFLFFSDAWEDSLAQSEADCAQKGTWISDVFLDKSEKQNPTKQFGLSCRLQSYSALSHFRGGVVPCDRALRELNAIHIVSVDDHAPAIMCLIVGDHVPRDID